MQVPPKKKEEGATNRIEIGATAIFNDKASVSSVTESQTASQFESEASDIVCTFFFYVSKILQIFQVMKIYDV